MVKDDKVLLVKGNKQRDFWEVPGGRIDGTESIEETLKRELKEEIANVRNIKIGNILAAYRVQHDIADDISLILIFYEVTADFDGEPQLSEEHEEWKWATKEEALKLVHNSCKDAIKQAFTQN